MNGRYVLTAEGGWIDLKHVTTAASTPAAGWGAGEVLGWFWEIGQDVQGWDESAYSAEDYNSNKVGAEAAIRKFNPGSASVITRSSTIGGTVLEVLAPFSPLTREEAIEFLDKKNEK